MSVRTLVGGTSLAPRLHCHFDSGKKGGEGVQNGGSTIADQNNGKAAMAWIGSGSPVSIVTIGELKTTLGTAKVNLVPLEPNDYQFSGNENNQLKLMGKMKVKLTSNGRSEETSIKVIGMQTVHHWAGSDAGVANSIGAAAVDDVMDIQVQSEQPDRPRNDRQLHFSRQLNKLFNRVGRIRNYKVRTEFFKVLMPVQQKGRRVPITLENKVDEEIKKLLSQKHIENSKSVWTNISYRREFLQLKIMGR